MSTLQSVTTLGGLRYQITIFATVNSLVNAHDVAIMHRLLLG